jgi:Pvc16 N-terminal domain
MALLNLSLVTQALTRLIEAGVRSSPEWPVGDTLNVTPEPPDKLKGERTIGFYLYHVVEAAHLKNIPPPGDASVPLRLSPMALELRYQLTPHSALTGQNGPIKEQLMMGLAMKTLRDFPVLEDSTAIGTTTIFPAALQSGDNRLRITLQPAPASEALQYWTTGSQPARLAAYYHVLTALFEPDRALTTGGRVLTYGVHTFLRGAPRLDGSLNRIQFTVPGETSPRDLELRPAEAAGGAEITLFGSELAGDETQLWIRGARWTQSIQVDALQWGVVATPDRVVVRVHESAGSETVLPGTYGAFVKVISHRTMPDGRPRRFEKISNETPFTVAPRIDSVSAFSAGVATVSGFSFDPAQLPGDAIQVFVGSDVLSRRNTGTPAAGEFRPVSPTSLTFHLPAGLTPGVALPLRILVNRAESAPRWVVVP